MGCPLSRPLTRQQEVVVLARCAAVCRAISSIPCPQVVASPFLREHKANIPVGKIALLRLFGACQVPTCHYSQLGCPLFPRPQAHLSDTTTPWDPQARPPVLAPPPLSTGSTSPWSSILQVSVTVFLALAYSKTWSFAKPFPHAA